MTKEVVRQLFCKACGINEVPRTLESVIEHLKNFTQVYKLDWQLCYFEMAYSCAILPPSNTWLIEESGATMKEAILRAVATVHLNMQKSNLSTVLAADFKSNRKDKPDEPKKPAS